MSTNSLYPGTTNGVCVTSIINDKIREYMMGDSSQQMIKSSGTISLSEVDKENTDSVIQENRNGKQDPVSTTDLLLPSSLDVSMHNSTDPCPHRQDIVTASVRRIGNSLDALLQESKRASHTKPVKKSTLANQQNTDRLFISSDQIRSRKSVTLHDICEEYIQFITVNSSVSTDEEAISTTSENETDKSVKIQEPELEIIPVSAIPVRNSQISVITINELASSVIRQSVEEMHVTVENECEKSNGEDGNEEKLITEVEMDSKEELFALNGVKSVVEEEHENSVVPEEETVVEKEETEIGEKVSVSISNGVNHDVNDDIEEEMEEDEEEVKESVLKEETAVEKPADETSMETDEVLPESDTEQEEKEDKKEAESEEKSAELEGKVEEVAAKVEEEKSNEESNKAEVPVVEPVEEKSPEIEKPEEEQKSEENKEEEPKVEVEVKVAVVESTEKNVEAEEKKSPVAEDVNNENKNKIEKKEVPEKETIISKESNAPVSNGVAGVKRRAEAGDDVETERDGGISSSSSSSGSETENVQDCKRIRFDESIFEEDERERLIREFVERSTESSEEIGKNCDKLQHEISALSELARAKELEWNSIMRLLKLKEEMLERISFKKRHLDCQNKPELDANLNKLYKNFVTSSTTSVDQIKQPSRSETCTPTSNNNSVTVVPIASSATTSNGMLNSSSQDFYKTAHSILNADSVGKPRPHRPILPKPPSSSSVQPTQPTHVAHASHTPILPHSSQAPAPNVMQTTPLIVDQNSVIGEGRQGPILDVKSIIADFRSKNPDSLPRRGRRNLPFGSRIPDGGPGPRFLAANTSLLSMANMALGTGSHVRTSVTSTTHNELRPSSFMMGQDSVGPSLSRSDMHMRSNIDSLMLVNAATAAAASGNSSQPNSNSSNNNNSSFQEALVKFAKMNEKRDISSNAGLHIGSNKNQSHLPPPPPYPEVTLHPVVVPQSSGSPPVQNSLLHGILTKSSASGNSQHHPSSTVGTAGVMSATSVSNIQHRPTTFSPTLARLLTAPERNRVNRSTVGSSSRNPKSNLSELLHSKKTRTEVTITPVTTSTAGPTKNGSDVVLDDDDESEATDRLVIDEGREVNTESSSNVIPADQVPECQGCHKKAAQFVCAGCGNQWYCSRECQVQAWEDHSEMCCG